MGQASTTRLVLLLLSLAGTKAFQLGQAAVKSGTLSTNSQHVIAPELFRNGSFAFAAVGGPRRTGATVAVDVAVTIADQRSADRHSRCSLTLRPDDADGEIAVTSLRRLSGKRVVLLGYEVQKERKRKGFLIALDVASCESLYLYSSFDLAASHALVAREASDKFEVFTNGASAYPACADTKSRVTFKSGRRESHCFEVEVDWSQISIGAFSFSEDVLMVRGFDAAGTYKVTVYNSAVYPYGRQLWLVLPHASSGAQVVSADLALCWISNPGLDKSLRCVLLDRAGQLRLNATVDYEEPVKLLSALSRSESDRAQMVVVAEKARCAADDCRDIVLSKLSDQSVDHRAIKLHCSAAGNGRLLLDVRQITAKGALALEYICRTFDRYVLHSVNIDDS